jgi:DoxX-like family
MEDTLMHSHTATTAGSKKMLWAGRIVSTLPALMLLLSGVMKLVKPTEVVEGFVHLGYRDDLALGIGLLELACTVLYLLPQTSVLGAVLLTGYLGGATATHVRVGEPYFAPILLGVLVWGGLYLRDERLRALLPRRRDPLGDLPPTRGFGLVLKRIFIGLTACVVVLAIVVALRPSEFRVVRSTTIASPPAAVFGQVNDFHNWEAWSLSGMGFFTHWIDS